MNLRKNIQLFLMINCMISISYASDIQVGMEAHLILNVIDNIFKQCLIDEAQEARLKVLEKQFSDEDQRLKKAVEDETGEKFSSDKLLRKNFPDYYRQLIAVDIKKGMVQAEKRIWENSEHKQRLQDAIKMFDCEKEYSKYFSQLQQLLDEVSRLRDATLQTIKDSRRNQVDDMLQRRDLNREELREKHKVEIDTWNANLQQEIKEMLKETLNEK